MDHFMLDGVKALFKFTIAILHLSFQVSPPSSNDVIGTIRNIARDLSDIQLLRSLVKRIKLPNSSYFAVKRSFYMVQSSFNSDLFYLQSLSSESSRNFDPSRALSIQPTLKTKMPAKSLINSPLTQFNQAYQQQNQQSLASLCSSGSLNLAPRTRISADRSKICVQNLGQRGRSHLRLINVEFRTHERSLMSPLRNCIVIGLSNCGKQIIVARQSLRRNFKIFREQDLVFHVHEVQAEIFDGFYLEQQRLAFIISHQGEVIKITYKNNPNFASNKTSAIPNAVSPGAATPSVNGRELNARSFTFMTETLLLRDCHSFNETDKIKLKLTSFDQMTNLLWIYLECEATTFTINPITTKKDEQKSNHTSALVSALNGTLNGTDTNERVKINPFAFEDDDDDNWIGTDCDGSVKVLRQPMIENEEMTVDKEEVITTSNSEINCSTPLRSSSSSLRNSAVGQTNNQRKILIIDTQSFDIFSAFSLHQNMGPILSIRTCLVAFCHFSNPMSSQFSSRIIKIQPTGRYEHLLSFSDVVDFMITIKRENQTQNQGQEIKSTQQATQTPNSDSGATSRVKRFLSRATSFGRQSDVEDTHLDNNNTTDTLENQSIGISLQRYCRALLGETSSATGSNADQETRKCSAPTDNNARNIQKSSKKNSKSKLDLTSNFVPMNMTFIFRNGKIALFEFTEPYAIRTRESQLGRYDYSKIIDIRSNGDDFIISILTVLDKLIKVVV